MKYIAVSGIADKNNELIPMGETFDDSRLEKDVKARFLKLGAIAKPEQVEAEIEEVTTDSDAFTQKTLMEKSVEELVEIAKGLNLEIPEKPNKSGLTKLILTPAGEEK